MKCIRWVYVHRGRNGTRANKVEMCSTCSWQRTRENDVALNKRIIESCIRPIFWHCDATFLRYSSHIFEKHSLMYCIATLIILRCFKRCYASDEKSANLCSSKTSWSYHTINEGSIETYRLSVCKNCFHADFDPKYWHGYATQKALSRHTTNLSICDLENIVNKWN